MTVKVGCQSNRKQSRQCPGDVQHGDTKLAKPHGGKNPLDQHPADARRCDRQESQNGQDCPSAPHYKLKRTLIDCNNFLIFLLSLFYHLLFDSFSLFWYL